METDNRQKDLDTLENSINQIKNHEEYKSLNIGPRINAEQQKRFKYYTTLLSSYEKKKDVLLQDYTSVPAAMADKIEAARLPGNYVMSKRSHPTLGNIHIKKEVLEEAKSKKPVQKMYVQRKIQEEARKRVEAAQNQINRMDKARPMHMASANTDQSTSSQGVTASKVLVHDTRPVINAPEAPKPMMIRSNLAASTSQQQTAAPNTKLLGLKANTVQGVSTPKGKQHINKPQIKPMIKQSPKIEEIKEDNLDFESEDLNDLI